MKEIPLTRGKVALVDDEDYDELIQWKWCVIKGKNRLNYYALRGIKLISGKKRHLYMHRFILQNFDMKFDCDHIDGNGLNNQKSNLRLCTHQENIRNSKKFKTWKGKSPTSQYKGVYKNIKYIYARIMFNGKNIHLGNFKDELTAAEAYDKAAKEMFGEYAKLNFPEAI